MEVLLAYILNYADLVISINSLDPYSVDEYREGRSTDFGGRRDYSQPVAAFLKVDSRFLCQC